MNLSPQQLLDALTAMFPDFAAYWRDSYFVDSDGTFSECSVFSELSSYVREHFAAMSEEKRRELFDFIEKCSNLPPDNPLSNQSGTCFLENLAGEPPLSEQLRVYMGPESRTIFDYWN